MITYEVGVTPYGESFMIGVPAFGATRFVDDKGQIEGQARSLISGCGAALEQFDIAIVWMVEPQRSRLRAVE